MSIVSSYGVEVLGMNRIFEPTIKIFREAIAFCIAALENEWDNISAIAKAQPRFNYCEHLLHGTAKNKAKYDFDVLFYKMPCYFRRAVVKAALGALESYHSNLEKWELDKQGKKPRLQADRFAMPCFYKDNMYLAKAGGGYCALKLYINNDWFFAKVRLKHTDLEYLRKYWDHLTPSAPTMEKRHGKYFLRFAFEEPCIHKSIVNVKFSGFSGQCQENGGTYIAFFSSRFMPKRALTAGHFDAASVSAVIHAAFPASSISCTAKCGNPASSGRA